MDVNAVNRGRGLRLISPTPGFQREAESNLPAYSSLVASVVVATQWVCNTLIGSDLRRALLVLILVLIVTFSGVIWMLRVLSTEPIQPVPTVSAELMPGQKLPH